MSGQLDILEPPSEPTYFCPGESVPVSQAVHRARLAAGWSGCQHCPSRDTEVMAFPASYSGWRTQVRRTRWGVRGVWQNAVTRSTAAQLTSIVTACMLARQRDADPAGDHENESRVKGDSPGNVTIVAGYDGRPSSPDVYAGVISAALQNGCNIIDVGHSTAASVQELCRATPDAGYAMLVTGAGEANSNTGFDVFDSQGQVVSVPWQSWGVKVRRVYEQPAAGNSARISNTNETVARLKHSLGADDLSRYPECDTSGQLKVVATTLELPPTMSGSPSHYRVARCSGRHQRIDAEPTYRKWLKTWFPQSANARAACICSEQLNADRLQWLFAELDITADVLVAKPTDSKSDQISQRVRDTRSDWGFCISDDDRYVTVANQYGQCLSAQQLSDWINESIRTLRTHSTTHVPAAENRVIILDAARPHQSSAQDMISDATALIGCVLQIVEAGISVPRIN